MLGSLFSNGATGVLNTPKREEEYNVISLQLLNQVEAGYRHVRGRGVVAMPPYMQWLPSPNVRARKKSTKLKNQ